MHRTHFRPRLAALDRHPVGHPDQKGDRTGTPAVAVDARGRAHLFVRDQDGGVSMRAQRETGGQDPWHVLGGADVQDELAAVTGESGRIELYAATSDALLHRRREAPGERLVRAAETDVPVRPDTLCALAASAEHTTLFCTDTSGELRARPLGGPPAPLFTAAGPGPVRAGRRATAGDDRTVLAQRSASGGSVFAAHPMQAEPSGTRWTESGPPAPADAEVALALDEHEEIVVATVSRSTGSLRLTRGKDGPGPALTAWREL